MEKDKYKTVKMFWEYQGKSGRLQYLRDWKIYNKLQHSRCFDFEWDDFEDWEKELIYKAYKRAINTFQ